MADIKPVGIYTDDIPTGKLETIREGDTLDVPIDWANIINKPVHRGQAVYVQADTPTDQEENDIWFRI